jgi:hypothetical protein
MWPSCDPPHGGRGRPIGRPIHDVADGRGRPIGRACGPLSDCGDAADRHVASRRAFLYIRRMARPSASLLLFPLPWQERLGVAFGWF